MTVPVGITLDDYLKYVLTEERKGFCQINKYGDSLLTFLIDDEDWLVYMSLARVLRNDFNNRGVYNSKSFGFRGDNSQASFNNEI